MQEKGSEGSGKKKNNKRLQFSFSLVERVYRGKWVDVMMMMMTIRSWGVFEKKNVCSWKP